MKKISLLYALLMLAGSTLSFAQKGETTSFRKGTKVVNLGYGVSNVWNGAYKLSGLNTNSFGPIALGFEYGITDKIGVGLQIGYVKSDRTSTATTDKLNAIMFQARGNYHVSKDKRFDPYIGVGFGYNSFNFKSTSGNSYKTPNSLGYTAALGARQYIGKNIGLYIEAGYISGSFAHAGLVAKF